MCAQRDYGTQCRAVSERFVVRDRKIVEVHEGTSLYTDAGEAVTRKQRQQAASLGVLHVSASRGEEVEDERCYFPLATLDPVVKGEIEGDALLKTVYRVTNRESYLDWGLTSDYESAAAVDNTQARARLAGRTPPARPCPPSPCGRWAATIACARASPARRRRPCVSMRRPPRRRAARSTTG